MAGVGGLNDAPAGMMGAALLEEAESSVAGTRRGAAGAAASAPGPGFAPDGAAAKPRVGPAPDGRGWGATGVRVGDWLGGRLKGRIGNVASVLTQKFGS